MLSRNALKYAGACPKSALHRAFATEAPAAAASSASTSTQAVKPKSATRPCISTAVILNRSPILTRTPAPFETAFYSYQQRIRRALSNPFPHEFYFKQGSLLQTRFNMEDREREKIAFGESFVPPEDTDPEKLAADRAAVEQLAQQEGEGEELAPREHPSDISNDVKSLDRKGQRNLYLLLLAEENGKQVWRFPQGGLEKNEFLHQAAQRDLYAEAGDRMDTWIVSRNPIGVYKPKAQKPTPENPHDYVFFYKAHIMAGQATIDGQKIKDFAWLTKEEIEPRVDKEYWSVIKDILSDF
ncbi:50S ribosomal subunit L30 [Coprinopsis cinerea okayama7|uniref:Large ribosomal subunit protein mL46 n=1 Tax=Coprinopsis cinerea (strain Okayama-7 / 130 / ATCC MYA-4618 / FGSC 9003) TaxID=240176 RepID=A8NG47_COPC7|nr:mitochondrial 54S ribosomal protein YmL17/YmL30 [Coprinopsis cinerea okayama7\|eukprot:XP_001833473.1 mitochondrial 54S ribosomal protein YmL17/YmL30 [Coprinopsis cinerea okayama7\